jgi:hypothetical protein
MVGGSAQRCVADRPSKPAGPLSARAVTIVLPVARWPIACQNRFTSIIEELSGSASTASRLLPCDALNGPRWDESVCGARSNCMRMQDRIAKILSKQTGSVHSIVFDPTTQNLL